MDRKVIMDDSGTRILIADLNLCGNDPENAVFADCIVWEWDSALAEGSQLQGKDLRIDAAKLRYSCYWKRDVVIFCGSGGFVGILDYETKEVLLEHRPKNGPHSVELLPNGDLAVACAGTPTTDRGNLLYYPLSQGATEPVSECPLPSAHGVCWDPSHEILWALGGEKILGCTVLDNRIVPLPEKTVPLPAGDGHEMVPVYGQAGKYWVSSSRIFLFDADAGTLSEDFPNASAYSSNGIKGIAWFPDGTMITSAYNQGGTGTYRSSQFRFVVPEPQRESCFKQFMIPHRTGSQTYKINTLSKGYQ